MDRYLKLQYHLYLKWAWFIEMKPQYIFPVALWHSETKLLDKKETLMTEIQYSSYLSFLLNYSMKSSNKKHKRLWFFSLCISLQLLAQFNQHHEGRVNVIYYSEFQKLSFFWSVLFYVCTNQVFLSRHYWRLSSPWLLPTLSVFYTTDLFLY